MPYIKRYLNIAVLLHILMLPAMAHSADLRIVNGQDAESGQWPWIAALVFSETESVLDGQTCAGTLIHPEWVLTAAHCIFDERQNAVSAPDVFEVTIGTHTLSEETTRYPLQNIIIAEAYNHFDTDSAADIALLQLSTPLPADTPTVTLLAADTPVPTNMPALLMGWGAQASPIEYITDFYEPALLNIYGQEELERLLLTEGGYSLIKQIFPPQDIVRNMLLANFAGAPEAGLGYAEWVEFYAEEGGVVPEQGLRFEQLWLGLIELGFSPTEILEQYVDLVTSNVLLSDVLKQVEVSVLSNSLCQQQWDALEAANIVEQMICFGDIFKETYRDSCSGDSGGPAVVSNGTEWIQVGITSYGASVCGSSEPAVYTRVSTFTDFITTHVPDAKFAELPLNQAIAQCPPARLISNMDIDIPCINAGQAQQWRANLAWNALSSGRFNHFEWRLPGAGELQVNENCPTNVACASVDADLNLIVHGLEFNGQRHTGLFKAFTVEDDPDAFYWEYLDHSPE